jgi:hypothetical protein
MEKMASFGLPIERKKLEPAQATALSEKTSN